MPLDRVNGEVFDGLHAGMHVAVPPRLLANLTNLVTNYTPKSKFISTSKKKKSTRPVFDDAVAHAIEAFAAKGAIRPIRFDEEDVMVQVYPKDLKVAVSFQRKIAGVVYYANFFYDLPQPVLNSLLAAAGKKMPAQH